MGSDNWPTTWSDDDHQYSIWGDGGGFGGSDTKGRSSFGVARIEGDHDNYQGVNRYGGIGEECDSSIDGKSHGAPVSIGGVLYAWVTPESNAKGYASFTLYSSRDKACTWYPSDVVFEQARDGVSFGGFVQFGKDNSAAIDAYVYTITAEVTETESLSIVQRPGRIMLLRAPVGSIEQRSAYEFFAGLDANGQPLWSKDAEAKSPIYQDADGVGPFAQMVFVPGLNRFVYSNQRGNGVDAAARTSLLTIAEAPNPWGPWTIVYDDLFFPQIEHTVFQWNFAPKWFRNDGRDFTLIFSGIGSNDSWNTIDGTFTTAPQLLCPVRISSDLECGAGSTSEGFAPVQAPRQRAVVKGTYLKGTDRIRAPLARTSESMQGRDKLMDLSNDLACVRQVHVVICSIDLHYPRFW